MLLIYLERDQSLEVPQSPALVVVRVLTLADGAGRSKPVFIRMKIQKEEEEERRRRKENRVNVLESQYRSGLG